MSLSGGLVNHVAASPWVPFFVRKRIYAKYGIKCLGTAFVDIGATFRVPADVTIGSGSFVNVNVLFDGQGRIDIGEEVGIASGVKIITINHPIGPAERRCGENMNQPVTIGRGSWLGTGAIILPGITVAEGCVIAAGAVLTRDTEPNGLYMGVPARRVRDLP